MSKPWEQQWNDIPSGGRPDEPKETGIVPWLKSWVSSDTPKRATNDTGIQPINRKFDEVFEKLIMAESRGKQFDKSGNLLTSNKGAEGVSQVMPKTGRDPGFGVAPMKDKSEDEFKRFGKDYLRAMLNEFGGDYKKALAAYNAGHANVKKAIEKGGENWMEHLPKKEETIPYVKKILGEQASSEPLGVSFAQATNRNLPPLSGEFKQPTSEQRIAKAKELGMNIAGAIPGIGDALSVKDVIEGFEEGNVTKTALGAIGLLPFVPASIRNIAETEQLAKLIRKDVVSDYKQGFANISDIAPDYFTSIKNVSISAGPGGRVPIKPLKGPAFYRETSSEGLDDILKYDERGDWNQLFVSNNPDLAIGQGANKGVFITFRNDSLSGVEHLKPGTGRLAGREFKTDVVGPRAVLSFTVNDPKKFKLSSFSKNIVRKEFDQVENADGSVTFVRKVFNEAMKE